MSDERKLSSASYHSSLITYHVLFPFLLHSVEMRLDIQKEDEFWRYQEPMK